MYCMVKILKVPIPNNSAQLGTMQNIKIGLAARQGLSQELPILSNLWATYFSRESLGRS